MRQNANFAVAFAICSLFHSILVLVTLGMFVWDAVEDAEMNKTPRSLSIRFIREEIKLFVLVLFAVVQPTILCWKFDPFRRYLGGRLSNSKIIPIAPAGTAADHNKNEGGNRLKRLEEMWNAGPPNKILK